MDITESTTESPVPDTEACPSDSLDSGVDTSVETFDAELDFEVRLMLEII